MFPCIAGGKRPLTAHGFRDASSAPGVIDSWWRRHPDANIGVPTGPLGGIDVVDVDVHSSGSGFTAFGQARDAGLVEGWAWQVRTPSGGMHAYFLRSGGKEQRSWQLPGKHVDFRGDGGYIVVPPSRVVGPDGVSRGYLLVAVTDHPQPWPIDASGLRQFLDPPQPERARAGAPAVCVRPGNLAAWVASRPEGGRNSALFWAACRMFEEGHDLSSTTRLLGQAAHDAGLPTKEAMATIRSAYRTADWPAYGSPPRTTTSGEAVGL